MKKKRIIITGITLLFIGLFGLNVWISNSPKNIKIETAQLEEKEIMESIISTGTISTAYKESISYEPELGEIKEVLVEKGDEVKIGDELVRYEDNMLDLEIKQSELQIQSLHLELEEIKKQHQKIDVELAKQKGNQIIKEQHDEISLRHNQLNIDLEQLNIEKELLEFQKKNLIVTANGNGTIIELNKNTYENDSPLISIGSIDEYIIEGFVSEYDRLKVEENQKVIITSDTVQDKEWHGQVKYISDLPQQNNNLEKVGVDYSFQIELQDKINLKPGFNMIVEFIIDDATVKTIPIDALHQENDSNYVFIVDNEKAKKIEVKIGAIDYEKVEIIGGIQKDDIVIINTSEEVVDGVEVIEK